MPLPAAPDPNAMRAAIMARLGLNPAQVAGFAGNQGFDDEINNYYRGAASGMSNLDLEQGRIGQDYETNLSQMTLGRDRARRDLENMFADRGMLQSSNFTNELSDLETDWGARLQGLTTGRTRGLEGIDRSRNDLVEEFNRNRQLTESEYAQQIQDFIMSQIQPPAAPAPAAPAMMAPRRQPTLARAPVSRAPTPQRAPVQRAPVARAPVAPPRAPTPPLQLKSAARSINPFGASKPVAPVRRPTSNSRTVRPV